MPFSPATPGPTPERLAVARLLAARGPLPGDEAAAALGWTADRWWQVVSRSSDWFELTGKGWALAPAGRAAVEAAQT